MINSTAHLFQSYFAAEFLVSRFVAIIWQAFRGLWRECDMEEVQVENLRVTPRRPNCGSLKKTVWVPESQIEPTGVRPCGKMTSLGPSSIDPQPLFVGRAPRLRPYPRLRRGFFIRACTHKSAFCKRGSVNVRFAPKATQLLRCRKTSLCAISGPAQVQQNSLQKGPLDLLDHPPVGAGEQRRRI